MASANFRIKADLDDLLQMDRALKLIDEKVSAKTIARVTQRALKQGVDVVLDESADHLANTGLSRSKVKRAVAVAYLNGGGVSSDALMSAGWFRLAEHGLGRKGGGGITNKLGFHRGAFKATMRSGHRGIFTRLAASRFPVRELWGLNPMREIERNKSDALEHGGDEAARALAEFAFSLLAA